MARNGGHSGFNADLAARYLEEHARFKANRAYLDQRGMFRRIVLPRIGVMKVTAAIPPQNRA